MAVTFDLTLLLGVEEGIVLGAPFTLLAFVRRTAYPDLAELGYVEGEDAFLGPRSHPEAKRLPKLLVVRFDAPLYYANVPFLERWLTKRVIERPDLERVVLDCRGTGTLDSTAAGGLEELLSNYRKGGVDVLFAHAKKTMRERFERAGWREKFGDIFDHATTREAPTDEGRHQRPATHKGPCGRPFVPVRVPRLVRKWTLRPEFARKLGQWTRNVQNGARLLLPSLHLGSGLKA